MLRPGLAAWQNGFVRFRATVRHAEAFAASVGPIALGLRREGLSLRRVAAELANRDIRTPRGGAWTAHAVRVLLARAGRRPEAREAA
jgi:hypothetical protein